MDEQTVVAAPSAAAVEDAPIEIPRSGTQEYAEWRTKGTLPEKKQKAETADTAAADTSKETKSVTEVDPESAKHKQETRRKPDAEARIKELTERANKLEADLAEARKPKDAKVAESSTVKAAEQKPVEPPPTRPKPKQEDKGQDGKSKYASYEEFIEDLSDWKAEQRLAKMERDAQVKQQVEGTRKRLDEARERYKESGNFDAVIVPMLAEMTKPDIPREVFTVMEASPVLPDLLYVLGGSEESRTAFLNDCRSNPAKALRVALLAEQEIVKELAKGGKSASQRAGEAADAAGAAGRDEKGKFTAKTETVTAPAKRGPESAAEPPLEIESRGSGVVDDTDRALKDGAGDDPVATRKWLKAENDKEMRKRRGA